MTYAVELRDVFRVHSTPEGDAAALQGLSLTVRAGEVVTILGPSGSGKTSLLRLLAGLDRPSAGTVRVFGADLAKLSGGQLAAYRERLGYADQHYERALAPELSARELVGLQLGLRGMRRAKRLAAADDLLDRLGLLGKRHALPRELSGGEQQRVAVSAALAQGPRLFLADEPTGELDRENARHVYDLIGSLSRELGCTTIVVTHDPGSATIADRVVRIRDGRVSGESVREAGGDEAIVVGRGGWLRLPEELLRRAGIRDRATARVEADRVVVAAPAAVPAAEPERLLARRREARHASSAVAELRAVEKRYGTERVLRGVDGVFESGRLYAVTGASGSGKTTLLHLLAGLDLPTGGVVSVLGSDVSAMSRTERARFRRDHVTLVRQQPGLVPFLSARENVELALAVRGAERGASARARESLEAVGLGERIDQRVSRLSTGERGRVAVARALAPRPALLLADEPTARLDEANALAIGALFADLAREHGTAIVCATHDPLVIDQSDDELALDQLETPAGASTSSRKATARE